MSSAAGTGGEAHRVFTSDVPLDAHLHQAASPPLSLTYVFPPITFLLQWSSPCGLHILD